MRTSAEGPARALLLALLMAVACAGAALADRAGAGQDRGWNAARELPDGFFSVNAQWVQFLSREGKDARVRRHAATMRRLGIETARISPQWNEIEEFPPVNGRPQYQFAWFDRTMTALAEEGIRASIYLVGVPSFIRALRAQECGDRNPPPDSPGPFAAYAREIAHRYGSDGEFWRKHPGVPYLPVRYFEVWNEPNWGHYWCPQIDPREYADLFLATARRIHRVDPGARVVVGGLVATNRTSYAPDGTMQGMETGRFLYEMLRHQPEARAQIDALGLHTYGDSPSVHLNLLRYVRSRMVEVGLGRVPIAHNEFGWSTRGAGGFITSERRRAAYIRRITSFAARSDCGLMSVAPYAWATREELVQDAEDWFGMVRLRSARPYRTAQVYSRVSRLFRGLLSKPAPPRISACL